MKCGSVLSKSRIFGMKTKIDKPQDLFELIREEKRQYMKEFRGGIVPSRVNTETAEQAMNELVNFI
jgi:hypothetical protein